ncbi:MAG TPA: efflux RND transporter periplasmic adaptor subunit [Terriglobales bacterium]|nr:efflux RND transporter periplasmic adaptor subunit [Terriglobales bacterium]
MRDTYKNAFIFAAIVCLALGGVLAYVLWEQRSPAHEDTSKVAARGPDVPMQAPMKAESPTGSAGATLSPVQLSPERLQSIGVTTATAVMKTVTNDLRVPGNVDVNERQISYLQTRFPGWIQKVFANASYQYVSKGQPMFTIYSPELVSTEQEYLLAKKNQKTFNNDGHGVAAKESDWLLSAAADRLIQFGVPEGEIQRLEKSGTVQHDITIVSPTSGYVTEFNALPNQYTEAGTKLYTIADLSSVWVYANVFQNDIGQLKPGTPAQVTVDAYPGRTFHGRIDQILPQVDSTTRTVRVRFVFSNPGLALKPGMFVNVSISVTLGRQLVIPASGALQSGTREIAFLDHGNGYLEPREIQIGPRLDDHVVVLNGLKAGDKIVSSANFLVDSEAQLQAAIGSFSPPPPGAGEAASVNPPAEQVSIDFGSTPSPPQRGTNTLRVKLTGADKKPIGGAQVTATFYMPAMPAMGMAAIKKTATLSDRGDGTYEGTLDLPSGGSYQVTLTATRNGQTVAGKQISLTVAGGM